MNPISDYNIFQNHLLGAHALWEFSKFYQEYEENKNPPPLILTIPVLPIVFNKRATDNIKNRNFKEGSLFRTITENKDIYSGLQERMQETVDITFKSLFIAASSDLILYDKETTNIIPNRRTELQIQHRLDYLDILAASKRIGAWFGQLSVQEIIDFFNIKL